MCCDADMTLICVKSVCGVDLLHTQITIGDHEMEVCGLAKQEYKDGFLHQWWIAMEKE